MMKEKNIASASCILVVDDDESIRTYLRTVFARQGYTVMEAANGKEALENAKATPPSLVISDILMPVMDGYELCMQWKQDETLCEIPFIFHTGTYLDEEDEKFARSLGAEDFITRPIKLKELLQRVDAVLQKKSTPRARLLPAHHNHDNHMQQYRASLVRKLEQKMEELKSAKEKIEKDLITRMLIEAKLSESEELFRAVFEQHAAVKLMIDPDTGNILDANSAAEKFYGWSREVLRRMRIQDINTLPPEKVKEEMERAGRMKKIHFDFRHRRADGSIRDVEVYSSTIKTKDREFLHSIIHDVTDKKIIEQALEESEKRYRTLVETQLEAICRWKLDTTLTFVNTAYCQMVGKTKEELVGQKWIQFVPESTREEVLKTYEAAAKEKRTVTYEHEVETPDGRRWYRWVDVPVYQENGELIEFQSVGHDITDRVMAEQRLKQSEEKYRALVENAPSIICSIRLDGTTEYVNPEIEQITGYSQEEIIGNNWWDIFYPGDLYAQVEKLFNDIQNNDVHHYRMSLRTKHGDSRIIEWDSYNVYNENGSLLYINGIGIDITERVRAEEKLEEFTANLQKLVEERTAELKKAHEDLESFVYSVAHDLRAPIRHIGGFMQFLRNELGENISEKAARFMDVVDDAARHMSKLIDGLLDFARLGKITPQYESVDMQDLVNNVLEDFKDSISHSNISFHCGTLHTVEADRTLMRAVLVNLIGNAIKFSSTKPEPKIEIACHENENEHVISIRDNGVGFDMQYADKLFGVFHRLHGEKEFAGTGIGLASVKQIINRHGGRVWAEGEVGKGACFYFTIPKKSRRENNSHLSQKSEKPGGTLP